MDRFPLLLLFTLAVACDYAPAEHVEALSRDVEKVKSDQSRLTVQVESTSREQQMLQTSMAAMGSGFNVLTESVVDHGGRVETLERRSVQVRRDVGELKSRPQAPPPPRAPDVERPYLGVRFDARAMEEEAVRVQWCEADEGVNGFLLPIDERYDDASFLCWQFGSVALFRRETAEGPEISCLRDIHVDEEGGIQALDCDATGVVYRFLAR
jgi:hypothetical protein